MDTTKIKDKEERKKLKRAARKKRPLKAKRTDPRGSHKPKVKKKAAAGQAKRYRTVTSEQLTVNSRKFTASGPAVC